MLSYVSPFTFRSALFLTMLPLLLLGTLRVIYLLFVVRFVENSVIGTIGSSHGTNCDPLQLFFLLSPFL